VLRVDGSCKEMYFTGSNMAPGIKPLIRAEYMTYEATIKTQAL